MHIAEEDKDMIVLVGDLSYANDYMFNGTQGRTHAVAGEASYQPRWDTWVWGAPSRCCCVNTLSETTFLITNKHFHHPGSHDGAGQKYTIHVQQRVCGD